MLYLHIINKLDKDEFYFYYQRIRNFLFDKGVFFKCSYVPGSIGLIREQIGGEKNGDWYFYGEYGEIILTVTYKNGIETHYNQQKINPENQLKSLYE